MIYTGNEKKDAHETRVALARFETLGDAPPSYPSDEFLALPGPSALNSPAHAGHSAPDLHTYPPPSPSQLPTPPPSAPPRTHSAPQTQTHRHTRTQSSPHPPAPPRAPLKALLDAPVINGVFLSSRNEPLEGAWRIDPELSMIGTPPKRAKARPKRVQKATAADPHVTLDTRAGAITARFSVIGRSPRTPMKASVRITTRSGTVHVDMKEQSPGRYVDLDIYSKTGTSTVLLPRTFSGVAELRSRKGKLEVLAALSQHARILKSTDEEVLLLIGTVRPPDAPTQLADYVRFNSEAGTVRIGFTVEDDRAEVVVGFWQKLGKMLRGGDAGAEGRPKEKA